MTPKTRTIPLIPCCELGLHRWSQYDHSHIQITRSYNRLIKRWNMWQTESWCGCRRQILFSTWKNVFVWFRTQHRSHDQTSKRRSVKLVFQKWSFTLITSQINHKMPFDWITQLCCQLKVSCYVVSMIIVMFKNDFCFFLFSSRHSRW